MDQFSSRGAVSTLKKYRTTEVRFTWETATSSPFSYPLLLLFLLLLYSNVALLVPQLEVLQPVQTVGLAALLLLFIEKTLSKQSFHLCWPEGYLLLAFLGAAGFSCFTALWMRQAVEATADLAKITAIYFLIVNTVDSENRLRGMTWTIIAGGLFPALGALKNYWNGVMVEGSRAAWIGIFGNPNDLAYSLVILVPMAFFLGAEGGVAARILLWLTMAFYAATLFLTHSRGGMVGLLGVLAILALWRGRRSLRILTLLLLAAALLWVSSFWSREQGFTDLSADLTVQQRWTTIKVGLAMFTDEPLFGVGLNCSILGWPLYAPQHIYVQSWLHIHNTFIQVLSETGLMGFVPFVLLLATGLHHSYRMARFFRSQPGKESLARLAAALHVCLWGFVLCGLSGGYALSWFPYLLIGLVSSMRTIAGRREIHG